MEIFSILLFNTFFIISVSIINWSSIHIISADHCFFFWIGKNLPVKIIPIQKNQRTVSKSGYFNSRFQRFFLEYLIDSSNQHLLIRKSIKSVNTYLNDFPQRSILLFFPVLEHHSINPTVRLLQLKLPRLVTT